MPDEHSNLNSPAPARRSNNRRRGRRGGRGRGPRPTPEKPGEEIASAPGAMEPNAAPVENIESENSGNETSHDTSGGFREPHPEVPADFASHETEPPIEAPAVEIPAAPEPEISREKPLPRQREREPERQPEPPRKKQWVRPADFRPAAPTAITQAVEHATFIAEALRQLHEQMDEILELVEVAERQKLADERELDELRRALRRIQPQRDSQSQSRPHQPHHQPRNPRRDEPRQQNQHRHEQPREQREPAENVQLPPDETSAAPEAEDSGSPS